MASLKKTPPALPALPVLGNILGFAKNRHALLRRGREKFGLVFSFKLGPKPVAVLLGPEYHQIFFLETDKALSIEKPYENLAAVFGKVAFLAPPDVYLEQRPILQAPFRPEKMQKYATIMQREIQKWIDSLAPSGEIEITREMGKLVQTVAAHTLMGEDFQKRVGQEFWDLYAVLGKALSIVTPPHWPLPKNIRRDKAKKRMQEILTPIIAERRRYPEANDDFLQEFVNTKCRSGADADDETIVSLIRALMFASHETTAGQVSWMSGRSQLGSVRRKTWPAQALVANRPLPKRAHCSTCRAARSKRRCEVAAPGFTGQPTNTRGCSIRLRPTPGRSSRGSTPAAFSSAAGPMPDSISSCGDWYAPAHRITSRAAGSSVGVPSTTASTPLARLPSNSTRVTSAIGISVRFGRGSAGWR